MKKFFISLAISTLLLGGVAGSASGQTINEQTNVEVEPAPTGNAIDDDVPPGGSVIGGNPTTYADHPYYVGVRTAGGLCSGSLIDPEWVLTAAHCVDDGITSVFLTFARSTSAASEIIIHPLWNGRSSEGHDLALLRIHQPENAREAEVIQVGSPFRPQAYSANGSAEFVGEGVTSPGDNSTSLNEVTMPIRSDRDMKQIFDWEHPDLLIGAGTSSKTVCFGDSGGPLSSFVNDTRVQIGVTSFGKQSCDRAAAFGELDNANLAWIASKVPAVIDRWATCTVRGQAGTPKTFYYKGANGFKRDGGYSWELTCETPPLPGPPPGEQPPPGPGDTPPICDKNPRKCDPFGDKLLGR